MISELGFDIEESAKRTKKTAVVQEVNGAELADWLACSPAAITQAKKAGQLTVSESGLYPLKANVRKYISGLRARKAPREDGIDLERSLQFWKVENEKAKNLQWRLRFGQGIAVNILSQIGNTLSLLRQEFEGQASISERIQQVISCLRGVDTDEAVYKTENEDNEPGDFQQE